MPTVLRVLLAVLGSAAVAIALSIMLLGAQETAWTAERVSGAIFGWRAPLTPPWPPTMDSELRFYAALWGAYGLLLLKVARGLPASMGLVPWLAGVFFVGGVGRAVSFAAVGAPHPFFTLLMAIELLTPPVIWLLWASGNRRQLSLSAGA